MLLDLALDFLMSKPKPFLLLGMLPPPSRDVSHPFPQRVDLPFPLSFLCALSFLFFILLSCGESGAKEVGVPAMPVWVRIWSFFKSNTAAVALRPAFSRTTIKITHTRVDLFFPFSAFFEVFSGLSSATICPSLSISISP